MAKLRWVSCEHEPELGVRVLSLGAAKKANESLRILHQVNRFHLSGVRWDSFRSVSICTLMFFFSKTKLKLIKKKKMKEQKNKRIVRGKKKKCDSSKKKKRRIEKSIATKFTKEIRWILQYRF